MNRIIITMLFLGSVCQALHASTIDYEVSSLGGNTWEYSYTVSNDTLAVDIEEFSIYFALGSYENLSLGFTPTDWDPLLLQPEPAPLLEDGLYDVLALSGGIAPGGSLAGFSVQFDFLGSGIPGAQFFEILDPNTFAVLDSGDTTLNVQSVPLPGTLGLFAAGLLGWHRLHRGKQSTHLKPHLGNRIRFNFSFGG